MLPLRWKSVAASCFLNIFFTVMVNLCKFETSSNITWSFDHLRHTCLIPLLLFF